jgi:hypothetical protein
MRCRLSFLLALGLLAVLCPSPARTDQLTAQSTMTVTKNIRGQTAGSHAGDSPSDGNDATTCAMAESGWTILPGSGTLVTEGQPANGSVSITSENYTPQHYCVTFHIIRDDRGHSAQANAYATAVETRPAQ